MKMQFNRFKWIHWSFSMQAKTKHSHLISLRRWCGSWVPDHALCWSPCPLLGWVVLLRAANHTHIQRNITEINIRTTALHKKVIDHLKLPCCFKSVWLSSFRETKEEKNLDLHRWAAIALLVMFSRYMAMPKSWTIHYFRISSFQSNQMICFTKIVWMIWFWSSTQSVSHRKLSNGISLCGP